MSSFFAAVAFLTRVPIPRRRVAFAGVPAAAQGWFPAVGLVIGGVLVGLERLCRLALPDSTNAVVLVVALVVITGGLHLDGLADAADGLLGGRDRERRLEIMHDVHAGTYAVLALVSVLALKAAGIAALPGAVHWQALLLTPCLARFAMVVTSAAFPYAREEGLGSAFHESATAPRLAFAAGTAVVAALVLFGATGVGMVAFVAGLALAIGVVARRAVGGMTGDLYGATIEITEALLLLCIAAVGGQGWLASWAGG